MLLERSFGMAHQNIPGLLTINKVKPKELKKKSTRVANVHGRPEHPGQS